MKNIERTIVSCLVVFAAVTFVACLETSEDGDGASDSYTSVSIDQSALEEFDLETCLARGFPRLDWTEEEVALACEEIATMIAEMKARVDEVQDRAEELEGLRLVGGAALLISSAECYAGGAALYSQDPATSEWTLEEDTVIVNCDAGPDLVRPSMGGAVVFERQVDGTFRYAVAAVVVGEQGAGILLSSPRRSERFIIEF